ncbi:hypothetical protein ANME2D_00533 [Candidatus Methanoperedens nitroreducens]|uniref:Uncharacterized protein n=1 Tax=Candidatus Methanoperedens nitratireducens TaxID=1392998 RepID=A0A062VE67_9EURY|nr:hypothetical protein [Candidatus Methanoperedens nitroreducens]KCZ73465.1 hypothetical protein ANME2D_00533 [Candidatus Methanoperedens nitroreducens]MDJ1422579.1 hypothetical protein [Candidatus Methanoperedens sp.]
MKILSADEAVILLESMSAKDVTPHERAALGMAVRVLMKDRGSGSEAPPPPQTQLKLPKQYAQFWQELQRIYELSDEDMDQIVTEQMIHYLNLMHDELSAVPVIGIDRESIKESMSLKL